MRISLDQQALKNVLNL